MVARFTRSQEQASIVEITPDIAGDFLRTSQGNRRIRKWYVSQLAAAMRRGEWRVTSQGIGIDQNGNLRDAHHRLPAVIESGVTIRSVLVLGLREDAYQVIDTGMKRTLADLLNEDTRVADAIRLASNLYWGTTSPTVDQTKPLYACGLPDSLHALIQFCGTVRKYFSSAPMKLAASITIMNGGDANYVYQQYRAMCLSMFDEMAPATQALKRQVDNGAAVASNTRDTLTRGLRVFDKKKMKVTKIQVGEDDIAAAVTLVKNTLRSKSTQLFQ
jgi:hypothetical protein